MVQHRLHEPVSAGRVAPCVYPQCRDLAGDPRLTRDTICESCRRRYRRLLDWVVLDWVEVAATMPAPLSGARAVRAARREFGHPAEWASDTAADVADHLNWAEDGLRDHLGHDPAVHPRHAEARRVALAHHYLTSWFAELCTYPAAADTAVELCDVHGRVRGALGHTRPVWLLPTPCPQCDLLTLTRSVDRASGDRIDCGNCGNVIEGRHYGLYTRMVLAEMIGADEADTG